MSTFYEVLGVAKDSSRAEIRAAYVRLIKEAHPDVNQDLDDTTERARLIVEAYGTLRDKQKRNEYDQFLAGTPKFPSRRTGTTTPAAETEPPSVAAIRPAWMDAPDVACESCRRDDVVLKKYTFAWVMSLIIETRHGTDTLILCNSCRIKKSIAYLTRVVLLGWWAIPMGVIYSTIAVVQDTFGGSASKTENATLLAEHGYHLFARGFYEESLISFEESQRLVSTRDKGIFIGRLKKLTLPQTKRELFIRHLWDLNPAWSIIPVVGLVCLGIAISCHAALNHPIVHDLVPDGATQLSISEQNRLVKEAQTDHFDLTQFSGDVESCIDAVKRAQIYVQESVPLVGTGKEGTTVVSEFAFDRDKLSADALYKPAQSIGSSLSGALSIVTTFGSLAELPADLQQYITGQIDFLRSSYYNVDILAISVDQNNSTDSLAQATNTANALTSLQQDPRLGDWISRSGQTVRIAEVLRRIEVEEKAQAIKANITAMQADSDHLQQQLNDDQNEMDSAKQSGNLDSYNFLVPTYNAAVAHASAEDAAINVKVNQFNVLAKTLNVNTVNDAFDDCLNGNPLFNTFNFVDLKQSDKR